MLKLQDINLGTDSSAVRFVKHEIVEVRFAESDGELISREGPNRFQAGDALITGSTGDQWSVSRTRFDEKYEPVIEMGVGEGEGVGVGVGVGVGEGVGITSRYQSKPIPVLAKQIGESFSIARSLGGDVLQGVAHDWLLQYAPGDFGIVENARFQQVYRLMKD